MTTSTDGERPPGAAPTPEDVQDLVVIGGGVMGLFTAYEATRRFRRVTVLERGRVGDPATASYGLTRSYRRDYLDLTYARLADEAIHLWADFEARTASSVLVRCGCMNIAAEVVTPAMDETYAALSSESLRRLGAPQLTFDRVGLAERFPYLRADLGHLDADAGLVDLGATAAALTAALAAAGARVVEGVDVTEVVDEGPFVTVATSAGRLAARSVVITAGHGTNDVLARTARCDLQVPITKDRPSEAAYLTPPAADRHLYTADTMPVIAYLDTGVYLHPIVEGVTDAVKVGYYNPPDVPRGQTSIGDIAGFVAACAPGLLDADVRPVTVVDQCDYDLVDDDDFVLGAVPGSGRVFVGVGWRGTGYKFAPWVGKVLAQMAASGRSIYDLSRFDPARFAPDRRDPATRDTRRPAPHLDAPRQRSVA